MRRVMKTAVMAISLCLMAEYAGASQKERIDISDIAFIHAAGSDSVNVRFSISVDKRTLKGNRIMIATPILSNGSWRRTLPSIAVHGKQAKALAARDGMTDTIAIRGKAEQKLAYEAVVAYSDMMPGASLSLGGTIAGCCSAANIERETIAADILVRDTIRTVRIIEPPKPKPSTAEKLAEKYTFVLPISEFEKARENIVAGETFDDNMTLDMGRGIGSRQSHVEEFVERNKDGSLTIFFNQSINDIDSTYRNNSISIGQLLESVRTIENSEDCYVARIVVAGFSSPEGSLTYNERLAWDRAQSVKGLILNETPLKEDKLRVFNGAVDWRGLRSLVANSDMDAKEEVLDILDNTPPGTNKTNRLMQLKGGEPYKYMYENFFPELRNAAYIKVYYDRK